MKRIQPRAAWHCGVWMLVSLAVHLGLVLFWPVVEPVVPVAQPANAAPLALAFAKPGVSETLPVETPELTATRLKPAPVVATPAPAPTTPVPESVAESVTPARVQPPLQSQPKPAATMARTAETVAQKAETVPVDPRPAAAAAQPRVSGAAIASAVPAAVPPAPVVTQSPRYARPPEKPSYPSMARRRGWQGEVWLQIDVSPGGESGEPVLLRSSGFEVLDRAALVVARQWRFIPEMRDGRPVATRVQVPVQFALR